MQGTSRDAVKYACTRADRSIAVYRMLYAARPEHFDLFIMKERWLGLRTAPLKDAQNKGVVRE